MGLRAELVDMRHQSPLSSQLGDKTRCTISPFSCCDRYYAHRQYGPHWQLYPHYCRCTLGVPNMPPYYAACFPAAMLLIYQIANTPKGNVSSIGQKCRMVSSLNLAFRLQVCLHSQQQTLHWQDDRPSDVGRYKREHIWSFQSPSHLTIVKTHKPNMESALEHYLDEVLLPFPPQFLLNSSPDFVCLFN